MGYGILRGQKCKLGDIKGMEIHILRAKKSRSNPDIDTNKSKDNYAIIDLVEGELNNKVARRTEELPGQRTKTGKLRKIQNNAVRMYDFIITGTHEDIIQIDYKNYFLEAVEFMKRKFGEKNVMYAQVHLDERTPHLHLGLVPEYKGKLAAYQLFTPESMRKLQDEFYEQVSSRYGLERGGDFAETEDISKVDIDKLFDNFDENAPMLENVPKRKHKTAVELKSETLAEVNREKENLESLRSDVADAERQRLEMLQLLEDLRKKTEKEKKEAKEQEQKYCDMYYKVKQAERSIELAKIKETEYKESEKDLKKNNKELEEMREEKNKIYVEIDDKLTEPIKKILLAWDNKKDLNLAFINFVKVAKEVLEKLDLFVKDYKKPSQNYKNFDIKKNFSRGR